MLSLYVELTLRVIVQLELHKKKKVVLAPFYFLFFLHFFSCIYSGGATTFCLDSGSNEYEVSGLMQIVTDLSNIWH